MSPFSPKALAALGEMEKACAECVPIYDSLEALGVDVSDRRANNDFRRAGCERCREVHRQAQQGLLDQQVNGGR